MTRTASLENRIWAKNGVRVDPDTDNAAGADLLTVEGGNIDSQGPFSTHFNFQQHRMNLLLNEVEQDGILEWSDKTNYGVGSFCKVGMGVYQSAIANNKNNAPASSPASWVLIPFAALLCRGIVKSRAITDPPATPAAGDAYIIPASATGAWSGKTNQVTVWHGAQWVFSNPVGYPLFVVAEGVHVYWDGTIYKGLAGTGDVTGPTSSSDGEVALFSGTSGKGIKGSKLRVDSDGNLWGHGAKIKVIAGTSYTVLGEDCGKVLWFSSASAVTVTLPQTSTEAIPDGMQAVAIQGGDGIVTFQKQGSEGIVSFGDLLSTAGKGAPVSFMRQGDGVWWLGGQLA